MKLIISVVATCPYNPQYCASNRQPTEYLQRLLLIEPQIHPRHASAIRRASDKRTVWDRSSGRERRPMANGGSLAGSSRGVLRPVIA